MDLKPILRMAEVAVKAEIEKDLDPSVDKALAILAEKIPGKFDDMLIAQAAPVLKEEIKKALLGLADKIDGEVG